MAKNSNQGCVCDLRSRWLQIGGGGTGRWNNYYFFIPLLQRNRKSQKGTAVGLAQMGQCMSLREATSSEKRKYEREEQEETGIHLSIDIAARSCLKPGSFS